MRLQKARRSPGTTKSGPKAGLVLVLGIMKTGNLLLIGFSVVFVIMMLVK